MKKPLTPEKVLAAVKDADKKLDRLQRQAEHQHRRKMRLKRLLGIIFTPELKFNIK